MRIDKTIGIIGGIFILAGIGSMLFLPGEKKWNKDADIRVGSGADISGVIMEETLQKINEKYKVSPSTESSSFQDCCSNTAQWALNAKEINVGFYCPHIAKHTIENNEDVEIYGPVLMNGETIVYKKDWADVKNVGITQGRQQEKARSAPKGHRTRFFAFYAPSVAAITALMVCIRFSASSNTLDCGDSNTSSVTSISVRLKRSPTSFPIFVLRSWKVGRQ